jgi:large subunit ribosomal protein L21
MYAIVKTGGKQYKAAKDEVILVEKLDGDPGQGVELRDVLMVCDGEKTKVGSPFVKGARVRGEIVRQAKGPKIEAFNYKPKKNQRKRWGHRQSLTYVKITEIEAGS